jgi:hypothetical protein
MLGQQKKQGDELADFFAEGGSPRGGGGILNTDSWCVPSA